MISATAERPPDDPTANPHMSDTGRTAGDLTHRILPDNGELGSYIAYFERLAERAAGNPECCEIVGCNVQCRADEILAGWVA